MEINSLPNKLYTLCYRLTGNTQVTEELCLGTVKQISGQDSFQDVAQKAARLLLKDYSVYTPEQPLAEDSFAEVQQALNRLKVEERAVVVLHDVYSLPYATIAMVVGEKEVHPLCHQGRVKVSRLLKQRGLVT